MKGTNCELTDNQLGVVTGGVMPWKWKWWKKGPSSHGRLEEGPSMPISEDVILEYKKSN